MYFIFINVVRIKLLNGKSGDLKFVFGKELKFGDFSGFYVECLIDIWIGKERL